MPVTRASVVLLALSFAIAIASSGCAAVFRDPKAPVRVESDPDGADVHEGDRPVGKTPVDTELARGGTKADLRFEKPGYGTVNASVPRSPNVGWVIADACTCLFTFCIPLMVDAFSGAWNDVPEYYRAQLYASPAAAPGPGPAPAPSLSPSADPDGDIHL